MLDINLIRENPKLVKENLKKRFQDNKIKGVDDLLKKDKEWREIKQKIDDLRHKRNIISQEINQLIKQKQNPKNKINEVKEIPNKIRDLEKEEDLLKEKINSYLSELPNIIHKSVPTGKTEKDNKVRRKWGKITKLKFKPKTHVEILENLNQADFDVSAEVSGKGFYFLKDKIALLNQALIRFAIDFMYKKKYTYIEPPLMLRKEILSAALDLGELKNSIYNIEEEDLSLIGTSEHSLLALHTKKLIPEQELPKKYFSYTMCFRKEIGAHGINEKGLWRTHQFNKVEQFIFCKPEDSYKYYEELLKNSEDIYKKLKLPYRVLEFCSGDLASWKSKSCDIEIYRPTIKEYGEVGSLSNCTDYQARKLSIRVLRKNKSKEILHTLNNTAIATSRTMVAILENYQQKDGTVKVPKVLVPYMNGIKEICKS